MKKTFTKSFVDLLKHYYGGPPPRSPRNISDAHELFANYYGKPWKKGRPWRERKKDCPHATLSHHGDDGETLSQNSDVAEYGVRGGVGEQPFDEYVVYRDHLDKQSSLVERPMSLPAGALSPSEEYNVDVMQPLCDKVPPASQGYAASAATPLRRETERGPVTTPLAAKTYLPVEEPSHSKATEDDFLADMKSILSRQTTYDPNQRKIVSKGEIGASEQPAHFSSRNSPTTPEPANGQAIFDRIAQSMQHANAYDLGTVELKNRFSDFDRIFELQQKTAEEKKARKPQTPAGGSTPGPVANTADFIQDLDAIRNKRFAADAPSTSSTSLSQSVSDEYSRPFYDTGEHVLAGGSLYMDNLRVGKYPGVFFSYGHVISMADLYESVNQMMDTEVTELQKIKDLIIKSANYYGANKKPPFQDVSDDEWETATHGRYSILADGNDEHFAPNVLFKTPEIDNSVNPNRNHKSEWERHHKWAIEEAQKLGLSRASTSGIPEWPLIINAFGDHFLTDAFAAGHMINKEAIIELFKSSFYRGGALKPEGEAFLAKVASKAFTGDLKEKFSKLETVDTPDKWWNPFSWSVFGWKPAWGPRPNIDSTSRFETVLTRIAAEAPDKLGILAVKAIHDKLNKEGIEVTNLAAGGTWPLMGDQHLNTSSKSFAVMQEAVKQSAENITDPSILASNFNFDLYFSKVWKYVPQLTPNSEKIVIQLAKTYVDPHSPQLVDAAVEILQHEVNLLIHKLIDVGKLKRA